MNEDILLEQHVARLRYLGPLTVVDPLFGDLRLAVFPFRHDGTSSCVLPAGFTCWEENVRAMMVHVPVQAHATQFFVTIDSRFFTQEDTLRRPGIHLDGNFCADPTFAPRSTWGPPSPTWGGLLAVGTEEKADNSHVQMGFVLPYPDVVVPIGTYVSDHLGATLVASSYTGCVAWGGSFSGPVESGGALGEGVEASLQNPSMLTEHSLWLMSSNCPHQTLRIPAGARRTLIRITFPHNYDNRCLFPLETP